VVSDVVGENLCFPGIVNSAILPFLWEHYCLHALFVGRSYIRFLYFYSKNCLEKPENLFVCFPHWSLMTSQIRSCKEYLIPTNNILVFFYIQIWWKVHRYWRVFIKT